VGGVICAIAVLTSVVAAPPAFAVSIAIVDYAYQPATLRVGQGESIIWTNTGTHAHTATQDAPLSFWNTGRIGPGGFGEVDQGILLAAGTYPYHCTIHPDMRGVVRVPLGATPSSGTTSTRFTLTLSGGVQSGYSYDVQELQSDGVWTDYAWGVSQTSITFKTKTAGTYGFRSRLHRVSDGATSGWSAKATITVT
jgi:plastocyanin